MTSTRSAPSRRTRVAIAITIAVAILVAAMAAYGLPRTGAISDEPNGGGGVSTSASRGTPPFIGPVVPQPKMSVNLLPVDDPRIESVSRRVNEALEVSFECADGYTPLPLVFNGPTQLNDELKIMTTVTPREAVIEPSGEIPSVRGLIVNDEFVTHISDDVAAHPSTSLRMNTTDWNVPTFTSLTFCSKNG